MTDPIVLSNAEDFLDTFEEQSIDLLLFDPPYSGIIDAGWDNRWTGVEYARWFRNWVIDHALDRIKPKGSIVFFGGVGYHGHHPFWDAVQGLEEYGSPYLRNIITWKKRRAYGKSHDYLFCREEIAWFSVAKGRKDVTFNIPYTDVKRGYAGFNKKYPAKSEYKRVSNVWDDIPELMRPERETQKPVPLMERLVLTHSNPRDLVVDPFCGLGTTGVASLKNGRRFLGCDADPSVIERANERCRVLK